MSDKSTTYTFGPDVIPVEWRERIPERPVAKLLGIPIGVSPSIPSGVIALVCGPSPSEICVAIHKPAKTMDKPAK